MRSPLHATIQLRMVMRENCAASCTLCTVSSITTPAACPHHTWRFWDLHKPPTKLSHLLSLTWSCVHIVMEYAFSSKITQIKYQVTETHKKQFDLLCHHGGIKLSFSQDLRVSPLSWWLARNCWEIRVYVDKAQENIMEKGKLIYTAKLACLILCQKHTLEKSYTEATTYRLTSKFQLVAVKWESNFLFLTALLHWSAKYKPLCHILNWGWLSNIKL